MLLLPMLFINARSENTDLAIDNLHPWIEWLLNEHDDSLDGQNYIFFCAGHHGSIWSLITSDSSGIKLFNGTTRKHIVDTCQYAIQDTLSFINDNIDTISWGFDSLANNPHSLSPKKTWEYNPFSIELDIISEGKLVFNYNNGDFDYSGPDSAQFRNLSYLMFWLAAPSCRQFMPLPSDARVSQ